MTTDIRSFLRIIRLVVNQSTVPVMEFHERVIFLSSAVLCKSMWCYYSLCKIHRDDTFYNLSTYVCDWSLGTHEFSTFNFILKIGCDRHSAQARACGLIFGPCQPDQPGENIGPCQPTARNSVNTPANSTLTSVFKFGIKFHRKHKG